MHKATPAAVSVWLLICLCLLLGCSQNQSPLEPENSTNMIAPVENTGTLQGMSAPGHHLLGVFRFSFDPATETATVLPNREAMAHYNVTPFLLPPHCYDCFGIEIEEFWPDQHRMRLYITLKNPFSVTGYSVRAILMHNQQGWDIKNNGGYTSLFDDGGDVTINPFYPIHTLQPGHDVAFSLRIVFPENPDFANANFVVEASWPDHCEDVFIIDHYHDVIPVNYGGSNINLELYAHDWQNDIVSITLDATEIGAGIVEFEEKEFHEGYFFAEFFSPGASGGVEPGEYRLLVTALSNSPDATYKYFNFFINPLPPPMDVTPGGLEFGTHTIVVWDEYRLVSARMHYGIDIFDASDQEIPKWTGFVQLQDDPDGHYLKGIEIIDNYAFVSEGGVGIHVVDIESIYAPTLIGTIETGYPLDMSYGEGYLYVLLLNEDSDEPGGLAIIDPYAFPLPNIVSQFEIAPWAACIGVSDGFMYYIANDTLFAYDLADPLNPALIDEIQIAPEYTYGFPEMEFSGDVLYFISSNSDYARVMAVDVSDPAEMGIIGSVDTPTGNRNFCLKNGYAYVTDIAHNTHNITIIDIDPPEDMTIIGQIQGTGSPHDIACGDKYIYTTELDPGGICVYDSVPPESPTYINKVDKIEKAHKLILDGDYAYLVDKFSSFKVLDISPPERTHIINSIKVVGDEGFIMDMAIDGVTACILKGGPWTGKKLVLISIEDPENPVKVAVVGGIEWWGSQRIAAGNGYAVAGIAYELLVIDIDPPEEAHIAATFPTLYKTHPMGFKDDRLYLYSGEGLQVYDVENPLNPQLLGEMPYIGDLRSFTLRGNYAYAGSNNNIIVLNVSDPQNMEIVANEPVPFQPRELFVMSGFLFSASGEQDVWIADVFPPGTLEPVFNVELPEHCGKAMDVECQNGYMFITTDSYDFDSLRIYKWW